MALTCYIGNKRVYPKLGQSIKVVYANTAVTKSESFTMDIAFPVDNADNAMVFGFVGRLDVSKKVVYYDDVRLYSNGSLVISGRGTVLSVSDQELKLQVLQGRSAMNERAKAQNIFIDRIDYDDEDIPRLSVKINPVSVWADIPDYAICVDDVIAQHGIVGLPGKGVYLMTYDIDNDRFVNQVIKVNDTGKKYILMGALHPNLWFVLESVMAYMGYTIVSNPFKTGQFANLYIAQARMTSMVKYALPHWSALKLIEEIEKLFCCRFQFDGNSVSLVPIGDIMSAEVVEYQADDHFSSDYNEEGIDMFEVNNLHYNLQSSSERYDEQAPEEVWELFTTRKFSSETAMMDAVFPLSLQQRFQSICFDGKQWRYYKQTQETPPLYEWVKFGWFNDLRRANAKETTDLELVPVHIDEQPFKVAGYEDVPVTVPIVNNGKADVEVYNSVEGFDAVVNHIEIPDSAPAELSVDDDDVQLQLYILGTDTIETGMDTYGSKTLWQMRAHVRNYLSNGVSWGLQLYRVVSESNYKTIGDYHATVSETYKVIDVHHQQVIKFLSSTRPDPSKIFMFRHKIFLAAKIEATINDDGMDNLYTGYFHELLP